MLPSIAMRPNGPLSEPVLNAVFILIPDMFLDDIHDASGPLGREWHVHGLFAGEYFGLNIPEQSWLAFQVGIIPPATAEYNELIAAVTTAFRRYAWRHDQDIRFGELDDDYRRSLIALFPDGERTWGELDDADRENLLKPDVRAVVLIRMTSHRI